CPNDTFIFHALTHAVVEAPALAFRERLEDVETRTRLPRDGVLDVTKASYAATPHLLDDYGRLRSGGALGRACGPLLVARGSAATSCCAAEGRCGGGAGRCWWRASRSPATPCGAAASPFRAASPPRTSCCGSTTRSCRRASSTSTATSCPRCCEERWTPG